MRRDVIFLWINILITFFSALNGSENDDSNPFNYFDNSKFHSSINDVFPNTIVNSVNVVTGDFCDSSVDIHNPGIGNLYYERSFVLFVNPNDRLFLGRWAHNHEKRAHIDDFNILRITGGNGSSVTFTALVNGESSMPERIEVDKERLKDFYTNAANNLYGRANKKNEYAYVLKRKKQLLTISSNNDQTFYKGIGLATRVLSGNRLQTYYHYKKKALQHIQMVNSKNELISEIKIEKFHKKEVKNDLKVKISGDGGAYVNYYYKRKKFEDKFEGNRIPTTIYTKKFVKNGMSYFSLIAKKEVAGKNYIQNEYYEKGKHQLVNISLDLNTVTDWRYGKVKTQFAPVGTTIDPICTHNYEYIDEGNQSGVTRVHNAHRVLTAYHHEHGRLKSTRRYGVHNPNHVYSRDEYFWVKDGEEVGNLRAKAICGSSCQDFEICNVYLYGYRGNVRREHFLGVLTGRNENRPILTYDTGNIDPSNQSDVYIKYYNYYLDDRDLLKSEIDDRKRIEYEYYAETTLLKAKFVKENGIIRHRTFYHYDKNSAISAEIQDDGQSNEQDNLTAVTQRYIKVNINRTKFPVGLPEKTIYKYLDLNTSQEEILSETFFSYTAEGWLSHENTYDCEGHLISSQSWKYDQMGNVIEKIDPLGQVTTRKYDEVKNLIFEQTPRKEVYKNFKYDYCNRLIAEEEIFLDGTCLKKSYAYDYLGNKIKETDIYGNDTYFKYDAINRLIEVIGPSGRTASFQYNVCNQVIAKKDHYGNTTHISYTARGQPIKISHPDGRIEQFFYHRDGILDETIDPSQVRTKNITDYLGRTVKKEVYSKDGEFLYETKSEYDAFHLLKEVDAAGNVTTYEYDFAGRQKKITHQNQTKEIFYNSAGRIAKIKLQSDQETSLTTIYEYNPLGKVTYEAILDDLDQIQTEKKYAYDVDGNLAETITYLASGTAVTKQQFNSHGQIIRLVDAEGKVSHTHYKYDFVNEQGQRVGYSETTDPSGNKTITIKNVENEDVKIIKKDPFGKILHATNFIYNDIGHLYERTDDIYHRENHLYSITKRWFHNASENIVCAIDAVGTHLEKQYHIDYNNAGQKIKFTKADGEVIHYLYNSRGLLEEFFSSDRSVHYKYQYDVLENVIVMEDLVTQNQTLREYDSYSHVIKEALANGNEIRYQYDLLGRQLKVELQDGSSIDYKYNGNFLNKVQRINQRSEIVYEHIYQKYDKNGTYHQVKLAGNAGEITYEYDLLNRTKKIDAKGWQENNFHYDKNGNLTSRTVQDDLGTCTQNYQYDSLNQLIGENEHSYQYDSLNNRIEKDGNENNINFLNQVTYDGINYYEYDLNGNLTKISGNQIIELSYDALDRLTYVKIGANQFIYQYDAKNRRICKKTFNQDSKEENIENYLYNDQLEFGSTNDEGIIKELRILGIGKGAEISASVVLEIDGSNYVPIHDSQGNIVILLTMESGEIAETCRYTAYGEELSKETISPWRFSSKRNDKETGFTYFGYRFYSATLGRWITSDPIGEEDGPNLYAYVKNNPLTNADLYGLCCAVHGKCDTIRNWEARQGINDSNNSSVTETSSRLGHHITKDIVGETPTIERGFRLFYQCGVGTLREFCNEVAQNISDMWGGMEVTSVCNNSRGLYSDLKDVVALNLHKSYPHIKEMREEIRRTYHELLKYTDNPKILYYVHSKGGAEFFHMAKGLPAEIRRCIEIQTFGSAKIIPKDFCGVVDNYINPADIVPRTDVRGMILHRDAIKFTNYRSNRVDSFISDHFISSPGYQSALKAVIDKQNANLQLR